MEGQGVEPLIGKNHHRAIGADRIALANHTAVSKWVRLETTQQFRTRFSGDFDESRLRGSGFAEEVMRCGGNELCKDLAQTLCGVKIAIWAATNALTRTGVVAAVVSIQGEVDIVTIADRAACTPRLELIA